MSKQQGYILLHRKMMQNPIYFAETFCKNAAWTDLLLLANHKTNVSMVRGIPVKVPRGTVGYSSESLAQRWRWSRGKVNRFLNYLKSVQQIEQQNTGVINLISIVNYEYHQKPDNKQSKRRTPDGHQTVQEQRMKNNDKEKEDGARPVPPADPFPLTKAPNPKPTQYK